MGDMTTATINRVQQGQPTGGQFASHNRLEDTVSLQRLELHSEFIDETVTNQEAAAIFTQRNPSGTDIDFENELYDTYETRDAYEKDLDGEDSGLRSFSHQLQVYDLPSGGVAVFWG